MRDGSARQAKGLILGIGASAGGLSASTKLLDALGDRGDLTLILVQHLDPGQISLLPDLLATHTALTVLEARDGMAIERGHVYVIPPGRYLTVGGGLLHLTMPADPHGSRMPFDFLLHSLAEAYGRRAVCIVLSGTGADGAEGLKAIHGVGGLVLVQDSDEADYQGMPTSAVATGVVDQVLIVSEMAASLDGHEAKPTQTPPSAMEDPDDDDRQRENGEDEGQGPIAAILERVRSKTPFDFAPYKLGTLQRRIERRMAMAKIEPGDFKAYLDRFGDDDEEIERLSKDLLINVTGFFRDAAVFDKLRDEIFPEMIQTHPVDKPLRIWVAGCSSGEEAYSIAIVANEG